ncbi:MAG TPA: UDP-N-acetylmuramate:L-alanyl-gamma-D-glutamyl-meso-diaminopimelate ligase [Vicinamibacterales bacterium]|nr:UDP-N-acetylmuramate:L-alanyl-gamma-D-glutamyl-meso-diaminopimelate ligase [Vicinamibacterales bacterium]
MKHPRVHLIGICGTAMGTLAAMLREKGFDVRGSDHSVYPPMSDFLRAQGITLLEGYDARNISPELDLVVVGNAISRGNPELEEVLDRKIRYCSLPEAIRDHFLWGARSIVIAGTHGKTTTTSLAGWMLTHAGADPSVLIGGISENFDSSYRIGGGRDFVIEGDEYDSAFFDKTAKFLKYLPDLAVVANIEYDHADIYPDLEAILLAFRRFVTLIPRRGLLLLGADDRHAPSLRPDARCRVETFGLGDGADWQAHDLKAHPAGMTFAVRHSGSPFGLFEVALLGAYNVRNALAAIAVGHATGLSATALAEALKSFKGVRRRLQLRGIARDVAVYDDFAHHPTAIAETLSGVRSAFPDRRIWAIFEPRSATSCRKVFQHEFASAFDAADETVIAAVFRANLPDAERLSGEELVADMRRAGRKARHIHSVDDIVTTVTREARSGDLVIVMSNGGFDNIHQRLLASLAV